MLSRLDDEKRRLYALRYLDKKSMAEIAALLALREDALRMRYVRLRREIPESVIVLEDRGLTEESRELAEYFCRRYDGVVLEVHSGTSER